MRNFAHHSPESLQEAVELLERYEGRAKIFAGGTDLLGTMKDAILPSYPEAVIDLKSIHGMEYITEDEKGLHLGALTRLEDIAQHQGIGEKYAALAHAAHRTASPHIREMGTIAGNLCQDIRCWYYRAPNNRFPCLRKGGGRCYAIEGDNRYHSIMGGSVPGGCFAVHPSDTAPALIALGAKVITTKRTIDLDDFFYVGVGRTTVLEPDEIVREVFAPLPDENSKSAFIKFALRKTIDFPIVNCAAQIRLAADGKVKRASICLNAVYVAPYRAAIAEQKLLGGVLGESEADAAAALQMEQAVPMSANAYMGPLAQTLIKRSVLACK